MTLKFFGGPFDGLEIEEPNAPEEFHLPKPSRIQHAGEGGGKWGEGVASPGAIEFFSAPPLVVRYHRIAVLTVCGELGVDAALNTSIAHYKYVAEVKL